MNFGEFISMSGYGAYVWSAYGFVLAVLAVNFAAALIRLRRSQKGAAKSRERR